MASYVTLGVLIVGMFVEIAPIKISPLDYIGKRLNKSTNERIDKLEKKVEENDIDTIRNRIITSEALLRKGEIFSEKQWENLYKEINKWNMYHDKRPDLNGFLKVTIENINEHHKRQTLNNNN